MRGVVSVEIQASSHLAKHLFISNFARGDKKLSGLHIARFGETTRLSAEANKSTHQANIALKVAASSVSSRTSRSAISTNLS
jgi:hypothetical protein